jgi:hypothetical protein
MTFIPEEKRPRRLIDIWILEDNIRNNARDEVYGNVAWIQLAE